MQKLLVTLFALFVLTSCGQHPLTGAISSTSPDGKAVISVAAKKQTGIDPYTVTMEVKTGGVSQGSLQFEIAATAIDSSTVLFDWKDAQNCVITYIYTDGSKRRFRYYATNTNIILQEIKEN